MNTKNVTGETLVNGQAKPGDRVAYSDMANPRTEWEVVSTPEENVCPRFGWSKGYMLMSDEGQVNWTDLRQYGWVFA